MQYRITFSPEKNKYLKKTRKICFDQVVKAIKKQAVVADIPNDNNPGQRILVIEIDRYAYAVPYVVDHIRQHLFLKTVYPSRKHTKKYIKE